MNKSNTNFNCRVCVSKKIEEFKIVHFGFLTKNENWKSFFCFDCGSVSEFKIKKMKLLMQMELIGIIKTILIQNQMIKKFYLR